jgi:Fe-S-cluster-containing dehydrogenase component
MVSCKAEHVGNKWPPYTDEQQKHDQKWINPEKYERGQPPFTEVCYVTQFCQHCDNPACVSARPEAFFKRDDGIVMIDMEKAKGDKSLLDACPFGNVSWNEEFETAQKCTMCAHLLDDGWDMPRCVHSCPLRALSYIKCEDGDFGEIVKGHKLKPLIEGKNRPRVVYKNLYKRDTCFIAGSLAYNDGEVNRAAKDANVELRLNTELLTEVETDFFGEFKIDRIPKNSGTFELTCTMKGFKPVVKEVTVGEDSPCLDVMYFKKA